MADETREFLLKYGIDTSGFDSGIGRVRLSFTELNQAAEFAAKGFGLVTSAASSFIALMQRGEAFNDVSSAFASLQKQMGETAEQGIGRLRTATAGLLSDFELMKQSNLATQLGITPKIFEELAGSAEKLGSAMDIGPRESLEALTMGFAKAQDRMLIGLGINIDVQKAEKEYAKTLGDSTAKLTESGKQAAFRAAALVAIRERLEALGESEPSVSDAITRIGKTFDNLTDVIASTIEKNPELAKSFDEVNDRLQDVDVSALIAGLEAVTKAAAAGVIALVDFAEKAAIALNPDGYVSKTADAASVQRFAGISSLDGIEAERTRITQGVAKAAEELQAAVMAGNDALATAKEDLLNSLNSDLLILQDRYDVLRGAVKETNTALGQKPTGAKDGLIDTTKAAEEAKKKLDEMRKAFESLRDSSKMDQLNLFGDQLAKNPFVANIDGFKEQYRQATYEAITKGLNLADPEVKAWADKQADYETGVKVDAVLAGQMTLAKDLEERTKEAFQNSVDFFTDAFYNAFTGAGFDLEDMFKRVAAGFAGNLAASVAGGLGLDVSGLGNLQGLGGSLAQSLIGSVVGGQTQGGGLLSGLLGGVGGTGISGLIGSFGMSGAAAQAAGIAGPAMANGAFSAGTGVLGALGPWGIGALAIGGGLMASGVFNGRTNPEQMDRRNILDQFFNAKGDDRSFMGIRGEVVLSDTAYNIAPGSNAERYSSLVSGLGQGLGGGGKLGDDLTGIFANAISDAENFNEAIIQTQSLMERLGVNSEQVKDSLTQAFLDGKVSLDEFQAGIANLNLLAQEDLVGPDSITDALRLLATEVDNPRTRLKALQLTFKELADSGIDTVGEMTSYFSDFGPEVTNVFRDLASAGFDSFEDLKNNTGDQIAQIFGILSRLPDEFASAFKASGDAAKEGIQQGVTAATSSILELQKIVNANQGRGLSGSNPTGANPNINARIAVTTNNTRPV